MPKYCIILEDGFDLVYLIHLRRLPFRVHVRYVNNDPLYIAVRCEEDNVSKIYKEFAWIKRIEPYDPAPIFWSDWSE